MMFCSCVENLEFHGVMRFYLEDSSGKNVATKCLRVSSVWTTAQLIDLLSEKIRPDLKMLSSALWLWEVQAGKGETHKMKNNK